jgi:hypothetical protein
MKRKILFVFVLIVNVVIGYDTIYRGWFFARYSNVPDVVGVPRQLPSDIEPRLEPYVKSFYAEAISRHKVIHLTVEKITTVWRFSQTPDTQKVVGLCYYSRQGSFGKIIELRSSFVDEAPAWQLMWIIYHELGHCALGRSHVPYGIMAPMIPNYAPFPWEWDLLVDELFDEVITR